MKATLLLHSSGDAMITSSLTLDRQPAGWAADRSSDAKIKPNDRLT